MNNPFELWKFLTETPVIARDKTMARSEIGKKKVYISEINEDGNCAVGTVKGEGESAWHDINDFEFVK